MLALETKRLALDMFVLLLLSEQETKRLIHAHVICPFYLEIASTTYHLRRLLHYINIDFMVSLAILHNVDDVTTLTS